MQVSSIASDVDDSEMKVAMGVTPKPSFNHLQLQRDGRSTRTVGSLIAIIFRSKGWSPGINVVHCDSTVTALLGYAYPISTPIKGFFIRRKVIVSFTYRRGFFPQRLHLHLARPRSALQKPVDPYRAFILFELIS